MNQVIRISDQHIFDSISSAASSVDTLPNYLAKCIREHKFCKGELFEFYKGRGCNTSSEQYAKMVAKKEGQENHPRRRTMGQDVPTHSSHYGKTSRDDRDACRAGL